MKRIASFLIVLAMIFNSVFADVTVHAEDVAGNAAGTPTDAAEATSDIGMDELDMEGTNAFGNLLSDKLDGYAEECEENSGYQVISVEMVDNVAVVEMETQEDCTLVVGIYDDAGDQLVAYGSSEVMTVDSEAYVEIDTDEMPEYYYIRAYLVDTYSQRPLSAEYESSMYTQEMQEFLAMTTDDFSADRVLNLDDDKTNNFAVYSENTDVIPFSEGVNEVASADVDGDVYVIENIDEYISSLVPGDIFAYDYNGTSEDVLIVKVKDIQIDGTTATITGDETSLEEAFDYVKIDSESDMENAVVDADCDEGVSYVGKEEEAPEVSTYAIDMEGGKTWKLKWKIFEAKPNGDDEDVETSISGDISASLGVNIKLYMSLKSQYLELKIDYGVEANVTVTGKISVPKGLKLANVILEPAPGIKVSCPVSFVISAEASVTFSAKWNGTIGFKISSEELKNLTTKPKCKTEVAGEVKIFVGLMIKPEAKIVSKKFAYISASATLGLEINAESTIWESSKDENFGTRHSCSNCINGEIWFKTSEKFETSVCNWEKLTFEKSFSFGFLIKEFHINADGFGWGSCPNDEYKITAAVYDENTGEPLENAAVYGENKTNSKGETIIWLPKGKYEIVTKKDGYKDKTYSLKVGEKAKRINIYMENGDGNGGESGGESGGEVADNVAVNETNFPDESFRAYVEMRCDTDGNGVLSKSEIESVTDIDCSGSNIYSLDGVEIFTNLEALTCLENNLTSLDVSKNTALKFLFCDKNSLPSLDVSKNTALEFLLCASNSLTSLDVSKNISLYRLTCFDNSLTSLDVSKNTALENLNCGNTSLTSLDVSNNTALKYLYCGNNSLTSLDVSKNTALESMSCGNNSLTSLDVSNNTALKYLYCGNNSLTSLDVSKNTALESMSCGNNSLTSLDVSKNAALETLDCGNNSLPSLDVSKNIALESLHCGNNSLTSLDTSLDMSKNTALKYLYCNNNSLTSLDVSKNTALETLHCDGNSLTSLDVSKNTALETLHCDGNSLTSLDVSRNSELIGLYCYGNNLTSLYVNSYTAVYLSPEDYANNPLTEPTIVDTVGLAAPPITTESLSYTLLGAVEDGTTDTAAESTLGEPITTEYSNLLPNEVYNFYVVKDDKADNLFTGGNLLYIRQYTSDASGNLSITYKPGEIYDGAVELLRGKTRKNIDTVFEFTIDDIVYDGEFHSPECSLMVDGILLTEGIDYELEGDIYARDIGTYTIYVNGIGDYEGSMEFSYSVIDTSIKIEKITLNHSSLTLKAGAASQLKATVTPEYASNPALTWSTSNKKVATVDKNGKVTAVGAGTATITCKSTDGSNKSASCKVTVTKTETPELEKTVPKVDVSYRTHVQSFGWQPYVANGAMSGTSGQAKRLEGINISVASAEKGKSVDLGIQYTTHCQSYGWLPWSADGDMSGTEGEAKRLEAIMIQLTGADASNYDVYYRVHAQSYGWLGWAKNGAPAGTAGYAKRLEGIQIVVVKKGESIDKNMQNIISVRNEAYIAQPGSSPVVGRATTSATDPVISGADTPNVTYRTHVQTYGWQGWKYNGQMSGTEGQSKRLEGINIKLTNKPYDGGISYTTHVQTYGWQGDIDNPATWKKDGEMSGTSGEAKRLEAICITLTGDMAKHYDIYYRVHAQSFGWLDWAKNGAPAGTAGYAKRLEGIEIVLVPKGGNAPGETARPYVSK